MKLSLVFLALASLAINTGCGVRRGNGALSSTGETASATTSSTTSPAKAPASSFTNPFTGAPSSPNAFAVEAAHSSLAATINNGPVDWVGGGEVAWLYVSSAASRLGSSKGVPFCTPVESNGDTKKALLACAMRAAKSTVNFAQLNAFLGNGGTNELNCVNGIVMNSAASRYARASGYAGARIVEWDQAGDKIVVVAVPAEIGSRVQVSTETLREFFPALPDAFSCPYLLPMQAAMQRYCKAVGFAGGFADEWNSAAGFLEGVCLRP